MIAGVAWGLALAVLGGAYLAGYRRQAASPRLSRVSRWKPVSFAAGLMVVGALVLTPLEELGERVLWAHFLGVFLLTMVAAPLLLMASPLTLAFRRLGPVGRRRLRRVVRRGPVAFVTLPPIAWITFAVVTFLWQFTGLTEDAAAHGWVRQVEHVSLLAVGLLFWIPALALDPFRWRVFLPLRLLYVAAEMVHKALFGALFLALDSPLHADIAARAPDWAPPPMLDQTIAILISWIGGNVIFVAALAWLAREWVRSDGRAAHRIDLRLARQREAKRRHEAALHQVFDRSVPRPPR